jgi:peptidyl-prolyl cis-trans isomerase D
MLQKMRDNLQGWAAKVIIALIIITMAMFGFGAFDFFTEADPVVASVEGNDIRQSQLSQAMERQRQRVAEQLGENFDPSVIDAEMLKNSVLKA